MNPVLRFITDIPAYLVFPCFLPAWLYTFGMVSIAFIGWIPLFEPWGYGCYGRCGLDPATFELIIYLIPFIALIYWGFRWANRDTQFDNLFTILLMPVGFLVTIAAFIWIPFLVSELLW